MRVSFFCAVVVVAFVGCGDRELDCDPGHVDDNAVDVGDADEGRSDDDPCVLVASGCGCNAGGVVVAVREGAANGVRASIGPAGACSLIISNDPGCFADEAICDWGTCRLHIGDAPVRRR